MSLIALITACPSSTDDLCDFSVLKRLVDAVRDVRQQEDWTVGSYPRNLDEFAAWFDQNNSGSNIAFTTTGLEQGNGVVARKKVRAGERVFFVPTHLMMTSVTSEISAFNVVQNDRLLSCFPSTMLALRLLYETHLGKKSAFKSYINILPTSFHLPFDYSLDDFEVLRGTMAWKNAIQLLFNGVKQFIYLHRLLKSIRGPIDSNQFTLSSFLWALSVVLTRQNSIPLMGYSNVMALIPGWDMCNHAPGIITTYFDNQLNGIVCDAMHDFDEDEEITIFYGPRANSELLVYSGFCLDSNTFDRIVVELTFANDDPLQKIRSLLLNKRKKEMTITLQWDGRLIREQDTEILQILVLDKDGLAAALRSEKPQLWTEAAAIEANKCIHNALITQIGKLSSTSCCHPVIATYVASEMAILQRALKILDHIQATPEIVVQYQ
ncbi:histone-lysine N-methyltransferase setd3-like isoform X2 [Thraustotheca clavata]|uniref:protein-histidine N-methyltransferase n=1 Tax=Thraustotheca clavata TaxID=74557 RepID=A0A1V9Y7V7_9STRA|nr:histone-lysine N-methyltransferase setd3-like isoform X2 [Thraustotheca clavata]